MIFIGTYACEGSLKNYRQYNLVEIAFFTMPGYC